MIHNARAPHCRHRGRKAIPKLKCCAARRDEHAAIILKPRMPWRAVEKAKAEMKPGAWLVSLEFEAAELKSTAVAEASPNRPVWLYQAPFTGQSS